MSTDIELYPRDQTDFSHHGYALDDISNDIVTWQLNAKFTLTFDYPMFSEHAGDLVAENIVRVPVPGGKAAFRIAQVIKSMGHLSITAYHVFWDLNDDFIADTNIVDKDGQGALDQIMRAANYPTGFKVLSTIGNVTNARLVRMSIIKALLGTDDNSFLNRWGGEFDWQDFSFSVNPRLGKDRGVHFEYAHNLTGYEATKDSSGIITRLLPEGYNGLLLPELYVDSPKLGNYRKPKIGTKTYQDIKAIDETQATGDQEGAVPVQEAYELLRAAAAKEFSESHIDEAKWTYKLNVALLENTEEYKDLSITTTVLPGDTVTITHKLDGIDVRARLTGYTWQPSNHSYLTQTYDSTSRPDVAYSNLSSRVNEIKSQIELVDKVVIAKATNGMNSTGWGDQSPVDLNIAGKTGDVYYQTTAKGTIMWLFHDGQWNAETGDAFGTEVQKKVDTAIADVAAAKQAANDAVAKANSSAQLASMSNQTAQAAKSAADSANALATQAVSAASDAKTALATANSALETATDQKTTVATLVTKTDDLAGTIATLATKTDINKLSGEVTAAQTLAQQTADGLQLKADQSVVNTINGSVNQLRADLKLANDKLSLTMTKNDVTGLLTPYATQSWTQGQITATASQFNAQFNSINQRLQTEDRPNLIYGRWRNLRTWTKNAAATNAIKSIDFANSINTISYSGVNSVEVLSTDLPTVAGNQYMLTVDWTSSSFDVYTGFGWGPGVDFGFDANNFVTLEAGVTNKRYVLRFTAKGNDNLLLRFGNVADGQSNTFAFGNLNLQLDTSSQATTSQVASLKLTVDGLATTVANNQGQTTTALQTLQGFQNTATNQLTGLQSQQTQLQDAINLRVSKGDVLSQINLEANRTLIQSGKLVLDAPTVVFTGNAFIPSAAIASLSADKITTGTLNAANLNVINLNASAIVTGTISGANLAINLNTGMVEFQKGRMHSTDNNIDINIDQKYISVTDSNNSVLLKGGSMTFTQPYAFDSDQTPYLTIDNVGSSQTLGRGAEIVGRDVLTVSVSGENNAFLGGAALFEKKFSGISVSKNYDTVVGGANRGVTIIGGSSYSIGLGMDSVPSIMVGYNKGGLTGGTRINIEAEYVQIPSAWSKTTSSSPNAFVASDGALVRSTSASKYKVNIERTRSTDLAERLLTVPNAHWLDKAAMERYASGEQKELPQTNFGLIAEDLEAAGLEDLVVRGPDGELEGIQYDRIAAALLPLLAQMKTEIDEFKATA